MDEQPTMDELIRALIHGEHERVARRSPDELRAKVAEAKGVPQLADRLHGETAAELEADADRLVASLSPERISIDALMRQQLNERQQALRDRYGF